MKEDTVISQKINVTVFNWQLDHNEETHSSISTFVWLVYPT